MSRIVCLDPECVTFRVEQDSDRIRMEVDRSCPIDKQKDAEAVIRELASGKKIEIRYKEVKD
jgi:hypothetical protein